MIPNGVRRVDRLMGVARTAALALASLVAAILLWPLALVGLAVRLVRRRPIVTRADLLPTPRLALTFAVVLVGFLLITIW